MMRSEAILYIYIYIHSISHIKYKASIKSAWGDFRGITDEWINGMCLCICSYVYRFRYVLPLVDVRHGECVD